MGTSSEAIGCASFTALTLISIPITGFLISVTWVWFVTPIFAIRPISVAEGVGLSLFVSVINPTRIPSNYAELPYPSVSSVIGRMASRVLFEPLLVLAGAWLWHIYFMPH